MWDLEKGYLDLLKRTSQTTNANKWQFITISISERDLHFIYYDMLIILIFWNGRWMHRSFWFCKSVAAAWHGMICIVILSTSEFKKHIFYEPLTIQIVQLYHNVLDVRIYVTN